MSQSLPGSACGSLGKKLWISQFFFFGVLRINWLRKQRGEALNRRAARRGFFSRPAIEGFFYLATAESVRKRNVSVSFCRRDASVSNRSAASAPKGGLK